MSEAFYLGMVRGRTGQDPLVGVPHDSYAEYHLGWHFGFEQWRMAHNAALDAAN